MASVFELLGLKSQSNSTIVTPLAINNNYINIVQQHSTTYFKIEQQPEKDLLTCHQKLDLENIDHRLFMQNAIFLFKNKSQALQTLDQKIASSVLLGMVASSLSFIPFVGYFGTLGWGATVYFLMQRNMAVAEYNESMNLLVATCTWALGKVDEQQATQLTQDQTIRDMMTCLYPVLTEKQVRDLIDDEIENKFVEELVEYEKKSFQKTGLNLFFTDKTPNENVLRSKRSAEFSRCIYGYNKGKPSDYLDAFLSAFPDMYQAVLQGFQRVQRWYNEDKNSTPNTAPTA